MRLFTHKESEFKYRKESTFTKSYNRQSTFAKATVDAVVEFLHRSPHVLR